MLLRELGLIFWGSLCIGKEGKGIFVPGNLLKSCGKTQALFFIGTFALLREIRAPSLGAVGPPHHCPHLGTLQRSPLKSISTSLEKERPPH